LKSFLAAFARKDSRFAIFVLIDEDQKHPQTDIAGVTQLQQFPDVINRLAVYFGGILRESQGVQSSIEGCAVRVIARYDHTIRGFIQQHGYSSLGGHDSLHESSVTVVP
jgi:hypothetical protein